MGKKIRSAEDTHNYGIDLLRCVTMFMVVVLHMYNRASALSAISKTPDNDLSYYLNWGVRALCLGAVNIYGMISGYVMLNSTFKPRRYFALWLQVLVTALSLSTLAQIFFPEMMNSEYWVKSALPVSQRLYWYFTCYTGVFLLSPVINRGIRVLTERQATGLLLGCVALFTVVAAIGQSYNGDSFYLVGGYTVIWLLVMYVIGACLRKSGILTHIKAWKLLLVIALCLAATYGMNFIIMPESWDKFKAIAVKYTNPFLVVSDICLLVLFARAKFRSAFFKKLLRFVAPLTFGVYLLHLHPVIWTFLKDKLLFITDIPALLQLPVVLISALGIFLAGILLDWLRTLLFRAIRAEKLCAGAEKLLRKLADNISNKLLKRT